MAVQTRTDNLNKPFVLFGDAFTEPDAVLEQDAGRSAVLAYGTLMAKVAASQTWVPFTDETATDGSAIPLGIYIGPEVAAAALVAGDVVDSPILVGHHITIDVDQLVIENSKLLTTIINATGGADNIFTQTVKDYLANVGIYTEATIDITGLENT